MCLHKKADYERRHTYEQSSDDGRLEWFEEATHWVYHEESDRVNQLLLDFLARRREHPRDDSEA